MVHKKVDSKVVPASTYGILEGVWPGTCKPPVQHSRCRGPSVLHAVVAAVSSHPLGGPMLSSRLPLLNPLVVLSILLSTGACGTLRPGTTRAGTAPGRVITAERIARSGATNAWGGTPQEQYSSAGTRKFRGEQARISHRGPNSLLLSNEVLVIVDGIHLTDWTYLRKFPPLPSLTSGSCRVRRVQSNTAPPRATG